MRETSVRDQVVASNAKSDVPVNLKHDKEERGFQTVKQGAGVPSAMPVAAEYAYCGETELHTSLDHSMYTVTSGRRVVFTSVANCVIQSSLAVCGMLNHGSAPSVFASSIMSSNGTPSAGSLPRTGRSLHCTCVAEFVFCVVKAA